MSINDKQMRFKFTTKPHTILATALWGSKIDIRFWNLSCGSLQGSFLTYCRFLKSQFWISEYLPQKLFFYFWGQNLTILKKKTTCHLQDNLLIFILTPFICNLLQNSMLYDRYSLRPFLTENRMTDVTETPFLQQISKRIGKKWIWKIGIKLMTNKVEQVWCRYLTRFRSNHEYPRERDRFCPRRGHVKRHHCQAQNGDLNGVENVTMLSH